MSASSPEGTSSAGDSSGSSSGSNSQGNGGTPTTPVVSLKNQKQVRVGAYYSCAQDESLNWKCWGENFYGVFADGTFTNSSLPKSVTWDSSYKSVVSGDNEICAIDQADHLWCWGDGRSVPSKVNLADVKAVTVGTDVKCAIAGVDRALYCWGAGTYGELGNPATQEEVAPMLVFDRDVAQVSVNFQHVCAVKNSGQLLCWGRNNSGQVGIGASGSNVTTPTVIIASGVTMVSTGAQHTCALVSGVLNCWGANESGQLATGDLVNRNSPVSTGISNLSTIELGQNHGCGLDGKKLSCWGRNVNGQVGIGTNLNAKLPVQVLSEVDQFDTQRDSTCVVQYGGVKCWGRGGSLGDGSSSEKYFPIPILPSPQYSRIGQISRSWTLNAVLLPNISCLQSNFSVSLANGNLDLSPRTYSCNSVTTTVSTSSFTVASSGLVRSADGTTIVGFLSEDNLSIAYTTSKDGVTCFNSIYLSSDYPKPSISESVVCSGGYSLVKSFVGPLTSSTQ